MEVDDALTTLRGFLERSRNADGGWPYYAGKQSRLEPTAWALLALGLEPDSTPLLRFQRSDGLLVEPSTGVVNYGFNGLAAVVLHHTGASAPARKAVDALLLHKGVQTDENPQVRQNSKLQAWPWMEGTFSWVEPTAWCMLAVKKVSGSARSPQAAARLDEAERLLADRACPGGGWNFGNGMVYGTDLPAHAPSTATAIIALQDLKALPLVRQAVRYLVAHAGIEGSSSATSLAWLALRAVSADDGGLGGQLEGRAAIAEEFGNVAAAATLLYALECFMAQQSPAAIML